MPELHIDFSKSIVLAMKGSPITAEEAKKQYVSSRSMLHIIHKNWMSSGSGRTMLSRDNESIDVYKFVDKDDRQDFLGQNPSHILYFWEIGWQHQVIETVIQSLTYSATADGIRVPRVASSPVAKKQRVVSSKNSNDYNDSVSSIEMKDSVSASLVYVNKVATIQALLESKQRQLTQVSKQLGRRSELKTTYELELCTTDNEAKIALLNNAINQYTQNIKDDDKKVNTLNLDVLKLQKQLERSINDANNEDNDSDNS